MILHPTLKQSGFAFGVLVLLLTDAGSLSYGGSCQPPTPSPCAADGVCRPKADSWGHYETRWRSWPGEPMSQRPTSAGRGPDGKAQGLAPFELPKPEQEDLRGPVKNKSDKKKKATDIPTPAIEVPVMEIPAGEPVPDVPAEPADALQIFEPQSSTQPEAPGMAEVPNTNDDPPVLPKSLRQAAQSLSVQSPRAQHQVRLQIPATVRPFASQPIKQVNWHQPTTSQASIQLINPASAIVVEPGVENLQQAIYYEASDQDTTATK